jgi:type VI secretion system protein VasG
VFPPALLGRLIVLPYYPLSPTMLQGIVRLQLDRVKKRIEENHGIQFNYDQSVVDLIVSRCTEVASGGRMIDAILTNTMLPELSIALLERQMAGEELVKITVSVKDSLFVYEFEAAEPGAPALAAPPEPEPVAEPAE